MLTSLLNRSKANKTILNPERKKKLAAFQKAAGFKFKNIDLLNLSLTHRSVSNEAGNRANNERLEFLGDAILGAVCATLLFQTYSEKAEGDLAKIKSVVVSEDILAGIAKTIHIDEALLLGKGEDLSGGRTKKAILADAFEALIGAMWIDCGYKAAFDFVSRCISPEIKNIVTNNHHKDYKSLLQEYSQQLFRCYPEYVMVKRTGPEHERTFEMEVRINGIAYGTGTGRNKKNAEQEAAKIACKTLMR